TGDKEDGNWELLSTYRLGTASFLIGKYAGLAIVLLIIVSLGFGVSGIVGWMAGGGFHFATYRLLLLFSVCLSLMFQAVALLVGAISRNRWQALSGAVAIWFFAIIAWPPLL